jgi:leader peptidase (prepilin peptidase)/N-methyltransferase
MHYDMLGEIVAATVGAMVGVGIIGAADHFTKNRSLWPTPICPHCGGVANRVAAIPIFGPLVAKGRCSVCQQRSFWQLATLVQLLTAILGLLAYQRYGQSLLLLYSSIFITVLVAVGVIDLQHRLIPTLLVYPTIVFARATSPGWPNLGILSSLIGGGIAFGLFFALAILARFVFGEGALGGGDVTLAALIGTICGYPLVVLALALGAFLGGIGAFVMIALKRSALGTTIPYGPYLVAGVIYVLLSGNTLHPLNGFL